MVAVARTVSRFLYVESCGQCPACKFGTGEVTAYLDHIASGEGTDHDVEVIGARLDTVTDANRCFLGAQEQALIGSLLREFPEEFARLDGAAAQLLVNRGVKLVGVDWLSVGDEDAHHILLGAGVVPIEGLDLRGIEPGDYFLVAAPLKIEGSDGAPARVLLVRGIA